jgi:hypothetical protein
MRSLKILQCGLALVTLWFGICSFVLFETSTSHSWLLLISTLAVIPIVGYTWLSINDLAGPRPTGNFGPRYLVFAIVIVINTLWMINVVTTKILWPAQLLDQIFDWMPIGSEFILVCTVCVAILDSLWANAKLKS